MNTSNNKEGGFIKLIVVILIALLVMKYYNVTISELINWFKSFFGSILK